MQIYLVHVQSFKEKQPVRSNKEFGRRCYQTNMMERPQFSDKALFLDHNRQMLLKYVELLTRSYLPLQGDVKLNMVKSNVATY